MSKTVTVASVTTIDKRREYSVTRTGDVPFGYEGSIAAGATDVEIPLAFDVSKVTYMLIRSDYALVIESNSSSSPADTLTLVAGEPYVFVKDGYHAFEFGTDVTKLFITNGDGSNAHDLLIEALLDTTET